jgi:hypothetical protein
VIHWYAPVTAVVSLVVAGAQTRPSTGWCRCRGSLSILPSRWWDGSWDGASSC